MNPTIDSPRRQCSVHVLRSAVAFEVVALRPGSLDGVPGVPAAPGAVLRDALGFATVLHFAPGRWLVSGDHAAALATAAAPHGMVVEVTGKWQGLRVAGRDATRVLAVAIAVDGVLQDRECAAVTLFDCPALIARVGGDFVVWVQASYAAHLRTLLQASGAKFDGA